MTWATEIARRTFGPDAIAKLNHRHTGWPYRIGIMVSVPTVNGDNTELKFMQLGKGTSWNHALAEAKAEYNRQRVLFAEAI